MSLYRFPPGGRMNRASWGPMSAPSGFQQLAAEEEDYVDERMLTSQYRQLFPLQEDLAEWINKSIGMLWLSYYKYRWKEMNLLRNAYKD